jgi:hypothetical protein
MKFCCSLCSYHYHAPEVIETHHATYNNANKTVLKKITVVSVPCYWLSRLSEKTDLLLNGKGGGGVVTWGTFRLALPYP